MEHEACSVQGAMVILLRVSRALGLAPVHLARVHGGYRAMISRSAAVYGYILTFIAQFCGIYATYINFLNSYKLATEYPIGNYFINIITIVVTGIGSYGSIGRMRRMISHSALLHKINYDLNGNSNLKRNKMISVTLSSYIILSIVLLSFAKYMRFRLKNLLTEVLIIIFHIEYCKVTLLEAEVGLIHFDVSYVVRATNVKLRQFIDETNYDNVPPATSRLVSERVHDLSKSYVAICDLVRRLNAAGGAFLFILFFTSIMSLMFTVCNLIDDLTLLSGEIDQNIFVCIHTLWCGIHLFRIALLVEPWHQIKKEVIGTRMLLAQLMYYVTPVGQSVPLQLDLMFKQLLLNQPTMSPFQMFTFQRSLLTTGVGFVTTYLVILLQYLKNRWK